MAANRTPMLSFGEQRRVVTPPTSGVQIVRVDDTGAGSGEREVEMAVATELQGRVGVVALVVGHGVRVRIQNATQGAAAVTFCDTMRELRSTVGGGSVSVILTQLSDAEGVRTLPVVQEIVRQHPMVTLLIYAALSPADIRDAITLVGVARRAGIVLRGVDDVGLALRSAIEQAQAHSVEAQIERVLMRYIPPSLARFAEYCAREARRHLTVEEAAEAARMPRRTLERRLKQAGLPTAHLLIVWCRLLHAGWALAALDKPIKRIVRDMQFSSAQTLYYIFKHYTGWTPTVVRTTEGLPFLLKAFEAELAKGGQSGSATNGAAGAAQRVSDCQPNVATMPFDRATPRRDRQS